MQSYPGMQYGRETRYKRLGPTAEYRNTKVSPYDCHLLFDDLTLDLIPADGVCRSGGQRQQRQIDPFSSAPGRQRVGSVRGSLNPGDKGGKGLRSFSLSSEAFLQAQKLPLLDAPRDQIP